MMIGTNQSPQTTVEQGQEKEVTYHLLAKVQPLTLLGTYLKGGPLKWVRYQEVSWGKVLIEKKPC